MNFMSTKQRVREPVSSIKYQVSSTGDISVYMALVILLVLTSSAIVLSGILSKQIRLSQDIASSERAFYAANTGLEQALHTLANTDEFTFSASETIPYPDGSE